MNQNMYDVLAALYGLLAVGTVLLNSIVILTFFNVRALLIPASLPILSLAIADVFLAFAAMPLGVSANVSRRWIFGAVGCNWYAFLHTTVGLSSILHHAVLALERYMTIYQPLKRHFNRHSMIRTMAFLWSLVAVWCLLPILGLSAYVPEGSGAVCSIKWHSANFPDVVYVYLTFVIFCFVPFTFIAVCYTAIALHLHKMSKTARFAWGKHSQMTRDGVRVKNKAITHGTIMVITVVITWLPYSFVAVCALLDVEKDKMSPLVYAITAMFAKTSTLVNPIICFFWYRKFREGTKKLWIKAVHCYSQDRPRKPPCSKSSSVWYNGQSAQIR